MEREKILLSLERRREITNAGEKVYPQLSRVGRKRRRRGRRYPIMGGSSIIPIIKKKDSPEEEEKKPVSIRPIWNL